MQLTMMELIIHFQPIFNHSGERIETVEALISVQGPKRGLFRQVSLYQ